MPTGQAPSKFYTALASMPEAVATPMPINAQTIQRDASLVLAKVTSLLGYQQYLAQARDWKAQAKAIPVGFEREVQSQAASALTDTQALASAALRMTNQFKQSSELDRMLSRWIAAIGQSGPVQTADLVADLENETAIRQIRQAEGITDEIWSNLIQNLKNLEGSLSLQNGKLIAQVKIPGQDQPRNIALAPSAIGMPQTLYDLLQRGSFERLTGLFLQYGGARLHLLPGPERDLELADLVLAGSILSVQSMADHSRGLQDAGLAKYAGSAVVIIWAVAALAALVIGYLLENKYCKHDGTSESAACIAATILLILGILGLGALVLGGGLALILGPDSDSGCTGGVLVQEWSSDYPGGHFEWQCAPPSPPSGL